MPQSSRRVSQALVAFAVCASCVASDVGPDGMPDRAAAELAAIPQHNHKRVCADDPAPGFARCHAHVRVGPAGESLAAAAPTSGYGPSDLASAYNLPSAGGAGVTVAIVDAYDDPNAESDLGVYRSTFGLPPCTTANGCFKKVNQNGAPSPLPSGNSGWAQEISLDLDMVSAACPQCKILLVEASSASIANLGTAVNTAAALGAQVISNSYGGAEFSTETTTDAQYYSHPGVLLTVSSGDNGYGVQFPAASPHVLAVGGTSLTKSSSNPRGWVEGAWNGAGSGCSSYEPKPSYQTDSGCSKRTVADVSAVADPNTGVAVYDSYGVTPGWYVFGGTSVSSPLVGAIYAVTGRAGGGPGFAYSQPADFYDVTTGSNGTCSPSYLCTAQGGYDGPTGLGTPNGQAFAGGGGGTDAGVDAGTPDAGTPDAGGGGGGTCAHAECVTGTALTSSCSSCAASVCSHDPYCCNTAWDSICVSEVPTYCGSSFCSGGGTPDAGTPDAGTPDAGTPDAGTPDAGTPDAGTPDAGTPDAGTPDAGTPDAGTPDAGTPDAGSDGGTGSTCAHPICTTGVKLTATCDPCAGKICGADPYCCNTAWDSICVGEVQSICGQSCSPGGTDGGTPDAGTPDAGTPDAGTGGSCAHPECSVGTPLTSSCSSCASAVCSHDPYCCTTAWDSICVSEVPTYCGTTCP